MFNNWKQPIPTGLESIFGEDYQCNLLYRELLYRACNKDTTLNYGRSYVKVSRGQVLFGRKKYAHYLSWSESTVERVFQRLLKVPDTLADIKRTSKYTVVSIKNYNQIVSMDIKPDRFWTDSGQVADTSKSVKSEESEEEIKTNSKQLSSELKRKLFTYAEEGPAHGN